MKSLLQIDESVDYFTGQRMFHRDKHHIFNGANRKNSEKYGLFIYIEHETHMRMHGNSGDVLQKAKAKQQWNDLKQLAQKVFESQYGHEKWMREFHRNYIL